MLKTLVVAVAFLMNGSIAHATPPLLHNGAINFTLTLTNFGGGTSEVVGNQLQLRGVIVEGNLTGDIIGTDVHNVNANYDVVTFDGQTWSTVKLTVTSPCVGTFEGTAFGTARTAEFADKDEGEIILNGSAGCEGWSLRGTYIETFDAIFEIHAIAKKLKP